MSCNNLNFTVRFNEPWSSSSCLIHMVKDKSQVDEKTFTLHALKPIKVKYIFNNHTMGWFYSIEQGVFHSAKVLVSRLDYNSFKTKYDWRVENQLPKREWKNMPPGLVGL